jgi:hypothetical protein
LFEFRAIAAAVESTGQAQAEAQAQAEKMLIECQSEIEGIALVFLKGPSLSTQASTLYFQFISANRIFLEQ